MFRDVLKSFEGRRVLDRVSLEIACGEFYSLLGPSGAGKTTLLRLCAGFEEPDSGEVEIDGQPMAGIPPNRRPVNTVFQAYALFPHLTVEANVGFGLDMRRVPRSERDRRVAEILRLLKLEHLGARRPAQLSGGEQQRAAIARALVNRPTVILLDEPMAALDEPLRQAMLVELKAIQRRVGTTFVCVTHHQEEALAVSDRVAVMREGRIVQVGTPQEIYESPASRFVAEFIGRANLLTGVVVRGDDGSLGLAVDGMDSRVRLPSRHSETVSVGIRLTLVVRAECLRLTSRLPVDTRTNALAARVESVRYGGAEWQYTLHIPGQASWLAISRNDGVSDQVFAPGTEVFVGWFADQSTALPEAAQ